MLKSIEGVRVLPNVIHVSGEQTTPFADVENFGPKLPFVLPPGTIKHAQLAAIEHNRVIVARYRAQAGAPGEPIQPQNL